MSGRTGWIGYLRVGWGIDHLTVPITGGISPSKGRKWPRANPTREETALKSWPPELVHFIFSDLHSIYADNLSVPPGSCSSPGECFFLAKNGNWFQDWILSRFNTSNPKVCAHSTRRWRSSTILFPMIRAMIGWCHGRQRRWCGLQKKLFIAKTL